MSKTKITVIIAAVIYIITVCIFSGKCISYRIKLSDIRTELAECRAELERYRTAVNRAEQRERELSDTIKDCRESVGRSSQLLSEAGTSLSGLREALQSVRANEQELIKKLDMLENSLHHNDRLGHMSGDISDLQGE